MAPGRDDWRWSILTLASNFEGVAAMYVLSAWAVAAVLAAPFIIYYSVLAARCRGFRRTSWIILAVTALFVLFAPLTVVVGQFFGQGQGEMPYPALTLSMGLLPSIALGIALLFDAVSLWAMFAPTVGVALAWLFLVFVGDQGWNPLWAGAVWHATVFGALWFDGRAGWRSQRDPSICPRCGYNLTGLASGVCPECGTVRPA